MIKKLYREAGKLHGHLCPGLAIGIRAGFEAKKLLEVTETGHNIYCIAESRACYQDGIQVAFGTTLGNGNLELRDRGKAAFNFYNRLNGKNVRLILNELPKGMTKEETTDFILKAPLNLVFKQTNVHFELSANSYKPQKSSICPSCGELCREPFLRVKDGEILCLDCAEL